MASKFDSITVLATTFVVELAIANSSVKAGSYPSDLTTQSSSPFMLSQADLDAMIENTDIDINTPPAANEPAPQSSQAQVNPSGNGKDPFALGELILGGGGDVFGSPTSEEEKKKQTMADLLRELAEKAAGELKPQEIKADSSEAEATSP